MPIVDKNVTPKLEHYFKLVLDGKPQFVMDVVEKDDSHVKVSVMEITAWPAELSEYEKSAGITTGWSTEEYLEAVVKWDGCCHVWFADDGYVHICGVQAWKHHCALMEWIYKTAFALIEDAADDERWE